MGNPFRKIASWLGRRAQPAALDTAHPFFESEAIKAALIDAVRAAFADGVAAERARVAEILQVPGAEELPQLAMFLVLGDATAVQATSILAKAENDASKRVAMTRAQQIEPAIATLH